MHQQPREPHRCACQHSHVTMPRSAPHTLQRPCSYSMRTQKDSSVQHARGLSATARAVPHAGMYTRPNRINFQLLPPMASRYLHTPSPMHQIVRAEAARLTLHPAVKTDAVPSDVPTRAFERDARVAIRHCVNSPPPAPGEIPTTSHLSGRSRWPKLRPHRRLPRQP